MSKPKQAATGSDWKNKLQFYDYDAEGKVDTSECREVQNILRQFADDENNEGNDLRIKSIRSFAHKLRGDGCLQTFCPSLYRIFKGSLKHHFLEIQLASGVFVSMEKNASVILFQRCAAPTITTPCPAIRSKVAAEMRIPSNESLELIVEDDTPKDFDIVDIIKWIHEQKLLQEAYHVSDANCQHFVNLLWTQLSEKPYPNPKNFNRDIAPMRQNQAKEAAVEEEPKATEDSKETTPKTVQTRTPPPNSSRNQVSPTLGDDQSPAKPSASNSGQAGNGLTVRIKGDAKVDQSMGGRVLAAKGVNPDLLERAQKTPMSEMKSKIDIGIGGRAQVGQSMAADVIIF